MADTQVITTRVDVQGGSTVTLDTGKTYTCAPYSGDGGALHVELNGDAIGTNVTFSGNSATTAEGGAVYNKGTVTFNGKVAFSDNVSDADGGAISNGGEVTFTDEAAFERNNGLYGGALANSGTASFTSSATFTDNVAAGNGSCGGALENYGGTYIFADAATFTGNSANNGGAVFNEKNDSDTIGVITFSKGATFSGNTATNGNGGAIYNDGALINFAGNIDLQTSTDTWYNALTATVNWDLTGGIEQYGSINNFQYYTNESSTVKQTITVNATQKAGDYVLATGKMDNLTGKDTFYATIDGKTLSDALTVDGSVEFNGKTYQLTVSDNGTKEDATDDKLILTVNPIGYELSDSIDSIYNGEAQSITVTVNDPEKGYTVYYSVDGKQSWALAQDNKYSLTDATAETVTVYFKLEAEDYATTITDARTITIGKKELTVSGTSVANKAYDGNTTAKVTAGTLEGVIGSDDVSIDTATGTFDDKDTGRDKDVTISYTLKGEHAGNYIVEDEKSSATIETRKITLVSGDATKVFDGTPLTKEEVTAFNVVDGEGFDYSDFASRTEEGSSSNTFEYTAKDGTREANYDVSIIEGALIVTKTKPEVKDDTVTLIIPASQTQEVVCFNVVNEDGDAMLKNESNVKVSVGRVMVSFEHDAKATVENDVSGTISVLNVIGTYVDIINHGEGKIEVLDYLGAGDLNITNDQAEGGTIVIGGEENKVGGELNIVNETGNTINGGMDGETEKAAKITVDGYDDVTIDNNGHLNMKITAKKAVKITNTSAHTLIGDYTGKDVNVTNTAEGVAEDVTLKATGDIQEGGVVTLTGEVGSIFRGENTIIAQGNQSKIEFVGTNTFTGKLETNSMFINGTDAVVRLNDVDATFNASNFAPTMEISGTSKVVANNYCKATLKDGVVLSSLISKYATIEGNATLKDGAEITLTGVQTIASGKTVNVTGTNSQLRFEKDKTLTNNGTINVSDGAWFIGAVNGTFVNSGTLNVGVDGVVDALTTTNTGTINLKGGTYTGGVTTNKGTLNWDLSVGKGNETSISWTILTNDNGTLAITVNADDKMGDSYTIASNASAATGTQFTLTGVGTETETITVGSEAAYNGYIYTLELDNSNNLVFTADRSANPTVTVTTEEKWFKAGEAVTISGTVVDHTKSGIASLIVTGDGISEDITSSITGAGVWSYTYTGDDTNGNELTITATGNDDLTGKDTYTLKVDTIAPTITVTQEPAKAIYPDQLAVFASFADEGGSGIKTKQYSINGGEFVDYTKDIVVSESCLITFKGIDNAGNETVKNYQAIVIKPVSDLTGDSEGISWEGNAGAFVVQLTKDGFETGVTLFTTDNGVNFYGMPEGDYQARVKDEYITGWTDAANIAPEYVPGEPQAWESKSNDKTDLFFANVTGIWEDYYFARNVNINSGWFGSCISTPLEGKNKFADTFTGSDSASILLLTDDDNGDALFVDDIYTKFPEERQARIAQIGEIRAGAGDDIVDLTSRRFEYVGSGITVRGGNGNDIIWANKGENYLFGDAGDDQLVGATGNDVLVGGAGNDTLVGGGGDDIFCFCDNWGQDTVKQRKGGTVTLWFKSGDESNWNQETRTYTDGENTVKVAWGTQVSLKFGDDLSEQYAKLSEMGAFVDKTSERIYEDPLKDITLASVG